MYEVKRQLYFPAGMNETYCYRYCCYRLHHDRAFWRGLRETWHAKTRKSPLSTNPFSVLNWIVSHFLPQLYSRMYRSTKSEDSFNPLFTVNSLFSVMGLGDATGIWNKEDNSEEQPVMTSLFACIWLIIIIRLFVFHTPHCPDGEFPT